MFGAQLQLAAGTMSLMWLRLIRQGTLPLVATESWNLSIPKTVPTELVVGILLDMYIYVGMT